MSHKQIELEFRKSLEDTDYGLIVGCDGMLKGIWVPETMQGLDIPQGVVDMCVSKFGIDPNGRGEQAVMQ
jgi:hypothetical protein|tara:strand:- start:725 stop:934 length:210 start_codon:yes stop_codon:yes gene_type:complete